MFFNKYTGHFCPWNAHMHTRTSQIHNWISLSLKTIFLAPHSIYPSCGTQITPHMHSLLEHHFPKHPNTKTSIQEAWAKMTFLYISSFSISQLKVDTVYVHTESERCNVYAPCRGVSNTTSLHHQTPRSFSLLFLIEKEDCIRRRMYKRG